MPSLCGVVDAVKVGSDNHAGGELRPLWKPNVCVLPHICCDGKCSGYGNGKRRNSKRHYDNCLCEKPIERFSRMESKGCRNINHFIAVVEAVNAPDTGRMVHCPMTDPLSEIDN